MPWVCTFWAPNVDERHGLGMDVPVSEGRLCEMHIVVGLEIVIRIGDRLIGMDRLCGSHSKYIRRRRVSAKKGQEWRDGETCACQQKQGPTTAKHRAVTQYESEQQTTTSKIVCILKRRWRMLCRSP